MRFDSSTGESPFRDRLFPDQIAVFGAGNSCVERHSVSGDVRGNFVASLLIQAGVRAPNRDRSSLAADPTAARAIVLALPQPGIRP